MNSFLVVIVLIAILGILFFIFYNRITQLKHLVRESWTDLDIHLKTRHLLSQQLADILNQSFPEKEKDMIQLKVALHNRQEQGDTDMFNLQKQERHLLKTLANINLPALYKREMPADLKQELGTLLEAFSDTENKITASRRFYNTAVFRYNTSLKRFPGGLIGRIIKASLAAYFEVSEDESVKKVPNVSFHHSTPPAPHPKDPLTPPEHLQKLFKPVPKKQGSSSAVNTDFQKEKLNSQASNIKIEQDPTSTTEVSGDISQKPTDHDVEQSPT